MKIEVLKRATALDHKRVEAAFPLMSLQTEPRDYIQYLQALHGFIATWETELMQSSPEDLRELVCSRARIGMLDADLTWYGVAPTASERPAIPSLNTTARLLGAMYVMEGSALGGQIIARHLERVFHLESGDGNAYFCGFGKRTGAMWHEFCALLERHIPDEEGEQTISAAREMFAVFELWMLHLQARCNTPSSK